MGDLSNSLTHITGSPSNDLAIHGKHIKTASGFDSDASGRLGYRAVKRAFDVLMAASVIAACVLMLPITLVISIVAALQARDSPIYVQNRVGKSNKVFRCYKLRTMFAGSDDVDRLLSEQQKHEWQTERKVKNDPRITPIGKVLRSMSLDEMPQFFNVLIGDMSVVGPRPIVEAELKNYTLAEREELLSVRPGITGWWQVNARNDAKWEDGQRRDLELFYVRNAGLLIDLRIIMRTFGTMFGRNRSGK